MIIDELIHRDINIKQLTVEAPPQRPDVPFDPERDISPDIVTLVSKMAEKEWEGHDWETAFALCSTLQFLFPNSPEKLSSPSTLSFNTRLENLSRNIRLDDIEDTVNYKYLYPHKQPIFENEERSWLRIKKFIDDSRDSRSEPRRLAYAKILFPERFQEVPLNKGFVSYAQRLVKTSHVEFEEKFNTMADVRILFPDRLHELQIPSDVWNEGKLWVQDFANKTENIGDWKEQRWLNILRSMKICAAEELQFSDRGVEAILSKPQSNFQQSTPSIPEIRKF